MGPPDFKGMFDSIIAVIVLLGAVAIVSTISAIVFAVLYFAS